MTALQALASEAQIQRAIVDLLRLHGWFVLEYAKIGGHSVCPRCGAHIGLRGALPKGHPDILAIKAGRYVWIEVKTATGRVSTVQDAVHRWLRAAGAEVIIARNRQDIAGL